MSSSSNQPDSPAQFAPTVSIPGLQSLECYATLRDLVKLQEQFFLEIGKSILPSYFLTAVKDMKTVIALVIVHAQQEVKREVLAVNAQQFLKFYNKLNKGKFLGLQDFLQLVVQLKAIVEARDDYWNSSIESQLCRVLKKYMIVCQGFGAKATLNKAEALNGAAEVAVELLTQLNDFSDVPVVERLLANVSLAEAIVGSPYPCISYYGTGDNISLEIWDNARIIQQLTVTSQELEEIYLPRYKKHFEQQLFSPRLFDSPQSPQSTTIRGLKESFGPDFSKHFLFQINGGVLDRSVGKIRRWNGTRVSVELIDQPGNPELVSFPLSQEISVISRQ